MRRSELVKSCSTNREANRKTDAAMSILLDKIVPLFVYPAGLAVLAGVLSLIFMAWGWRRMSAIVLASGTAYLCMASLPVVAGLLAYSLERQYPVVQVGQLPKADAIVVLGGSTNGPTNINPHIDVRDSFDRVLHGARLFKAGLAPRIIVSGGLLFSSPGSASEAEYMKQLLVQIGVDGAAITLETGARNTYENARLTRLIVSGGGVRSVLLVTSAWHMPRAAAVFRKAGISFTPVSIDTISSSTATGFPLAYLPSADALRFTTLCMREWIGYAVYRLRGWL